MQTDYSTPTIPEEYYEHLLETIDGQPRTTDYTTTERNLNPKKQDDFYVNEFYEFVLQRGASIVPSSSQEHYEKIADSLFKMNFGVSKCCKHEMYRITFTLPKFVHVSDTLDEFNLFVWNMGGFIKASPSKRNGYRGFYRNVIIDVSKITKEIWKMIELLKEMHKYELLLNKYHDWKAYKPSACAGVKIKRHCALAKCHKKRCTHDACMKDCLLKKTIAELIANPGDDDRIRVVMSLVSHTLYGKLL